MINSVWRLLVISIACLWALLVIWLFVYCIVCTVCYYAGDLISRLKRRRRRKEGSDGTVPG